VEMSAFTPQTKESLMKINGVGQVKALQYGETFLELINEYCRKHNILEKPRLEAEPKKERSGKPAKKKEIGSRAHEVSEAYNAGESLSQLAERYNVTPGTIINHLVNYVMEGNLLKYQSEINTLSKLTPSIQNSVFIAFDEAGTEYLRPVFDKLNGEVDYDELKILRLIYLCKPENQPAKTTNKDQIE
jgi:ATP-dependent DNA helicase RecQ